MLVIGHRGAAALAPENTLRSFEAALALGVDQVETDVQVTADGYLVCIHDDTVDRTTNGVGPVSSFTLAEIKGFDAGEGERIPTLEEVLSEVRGRAILQIELKGEGTVEPTLQTLETARIRPDEVVLLCFDPMRLQRVRELRPDLPTCLLFGSAVADAPEQAGALGAQSLSIRFDCLSEEMSLRARERGLGVHVWTPNSREAFSSLLDAGIDGIATDHPDILLELLRERGVR